jgi:hypothetical protein
MSQTTSTDDDAYLGYRIRKLIERWRELAEMFRESHPDIYIWYTRLANELEDEVRGTTSRIEGGF